MNRTKTKNIQLQLFGKSYLHVFAILFSIFLVYGKTAYFSFTGMDDTAIIQQNSDVLANIENITEAFRRDAFFQKDSDIYYRPLQTISFMIDANLGDPASPQMYHVMNCVYHAIVCLTLYWFLSLFFFSKNISFLCAWLYSIHPLFTHAVAWIPSRGDLLLALFSLLSIGLFIRGYKNNSITSTLASGIFFTTALFCKETAAVIPILCIIYFLLFRLQYNYTRQLTIVVVVWIIGLLLFYFMRAKVVMPFSGSISASLGIFVKNSIILPETVGKYFIPLRLSTQPRITTEFVIGGFIIIFIGAYITIKSPNADKRIFLFSFLWFLIFSIPPLFGFSRYGDHAYHYLEHRTYLPMIGIALFSLEAIRSNIRSHIIMKWGIIIVFFLAVLTYANLENYRTQESFYQKALDTYPQNCASLMEMGRLNVDKGYFAKGLDYFNKAVQSYPEFAEAYYNRGVILLQNKQYSQALSDLYASIDRDPTYYEAYYNIGNISADMARYDSAIKYYTLCLQYSPQNSEAYNNRANVYNICGNYLNAVRDCDSAILLNKQYAEAYFNRGWAYFELHDYKAAIEDLNTAIFYRPGFVEAIQMRKKLF
jgi:Flp pilus assembly protein TadD